MSEWFHVGQKVVCINSGRGEYPGRWEPGAALKVGATYTVTEIFPSPFNGRTLVTLAEVKRGPICEALYGHRGYGLYRFRPLRKRSTDLSIFKAMLSPKKQEVEA